MMKPEHDVRYGAVDAQRGVRNPFHVMDVPAPDDAEVMAFAAVAVLDGSAADDNARAWASLGEDFHHDRLEGCWCSRWNGGADPAIAGDVAEAWKDGDAQVRIVGERAYLLFDWHRGERRGLIDARREGATRLIGKYINLTNPQITRPWVGLIVSDRRIDGRWSQGRLDFRR